MDTTQINLSTISSEPPPAVRPRGTKNVFIYLICAAVAAAMLLLLGRLLEPKYMSGIYEGALIREYYSSGMNHEVVFLGDCEVYENISPVTLWEEYGVTSYIRGSPQQLVWQSYYLLEDTLRYETPKAVVFNVLAMMYDKPQSEAYNRLTLDGMRLSPVKIQAVRASMTGDESLASYIFPILRYHERWKSLTKDDFSHLFSREAVSFNGFMMRCDTKPLGRLPTPEKLSDYSFGSTAWSYLDKMRMLCEQNGVELVLVKAPTVWPHWYDEWDAQIESYAGQHGLMYINALRDEGNTGIDLQTDTYNAGLHLNLAGAEKYTRYLAEKLQESGGLTDRRGDAEVSALWNDMASDYRKLIQRQMSEIEVTGKVTTLTREGIQ